MNEYKIKLLEYISENFKDVVKPAIGGEYIEIDLIPDSHDGLHDLLEILPFCEKKVLILECLPEVIKLESVTVLEWEDMCIICRKRPNKYYPIYY